MHSILHDNISLHSRTSPKMVFRVTATLETTTAAAEEARVTTATTTAAAAAVMLEQA